jgi:uncharacterized protein YjiS (DUF1127 family)
MCAFSFKEQIMTTNTATWGAASPRPSRLFSTLVHAVDALARARSKRQTAKVLADLDDHVLQDIGLNPGEVRRSTHTVTDWVLQSHSGTARLVFIGR